MIAKATSRNRWGRRSTGLARKSVAILRALLPFAVRSRRWFLFGCLAALGVVAGRLLLPWPLRAVADQWVANGSGGESAIPGLIPGTSEYVLAMGVAFLGTILLLGLFDFLERLHFARFAIGTVRDIRARAFWSAVRRRAKGRDALAKDLHGDPDDDDTGEDHGRSARSGDMVARLVGDTARIKNGLQGFLVHVVTNGIVFTGVTVILFIMEPTLGLIFAAAGLGTAVVTVWAAGRMFRRAIKQRKKEGKLAGQIDRALRHDRTAAKFVKINKSSGRHEAAQTQIQGIATCHAHVFFGLAVLGLLWFGTEAVQAGRIAAGDVVVMMMYALMMRGPFVRLARQGSRTGKILGAAHRLVQVLKATPASNQDAERVHLMPLRDTLRLEAVMPQAIQRDSAQQPLGPIDMEIRAGERVAIFGEHGAGKTALLETISGQRQLAAGRIVWDGLSIGKVPPEMRARQQVFVPTYLGARSAAEPVEQRLWELVQLIYRQASVWIYDDPARDLPDVPAEQLMDALLNSSPVATVIVATNRPRDVHRFDRVLHLHDGRLIFGGTPAQWRQFRRHGRDRSSGDRRSVATAAGQSPSERSRDGSLDQKIN